MIKISKVDSQGNKVEYEYSSINKACQENGATSGMNRNAGLKYLEKAGFDLTTLIETEKTERTTTSIIEKLIKLCATVDKDKIKELEKERLDLVSNAKTTKDMDKILKINDQIKTLQNPVVNLEQVQAKVLELWNEHQAQATETEAE